MYNSRSSHYRRQVLQPEQDHVEEQSLNVNTDTAQEAETEEPAASRRATPSQPPRRRAKRRRNVELEPEEEDDRNQVPNSLYKRAVYDDPETLKYIKKTTWIRIPDTVSKASRNIMTVHYQETLQAVAGSTDDNVSSDLEQNIRRIARGINQNIKTLVVPGLMDKNLLDPSVTALKDKLLEETEPQKRKLAYNSLIIKKQHEKFKQKMLEAEEIKKKLKEIKEQWSDTPIKATDTLQDYAQSLIVEPSSKTFESPE